MHCSTCRAQDTKVIDSRLVNSGQSVWRRRECLTCGKRFTTYETEEISMPRVIKREGTRVTFDEEKLKRGVLRALEKRPVSSQQLDEAMNQLLQRIRNASEREISTQHIGEWVMDMLFRLDEVAYVRFASVYRRFQDVDQFQQEILSMLQKRDVPKKIKE